jgi:hypothetical protein
MKSYPLVIISWGDANNGNGWLSRADMKNRKASHCTTTGRLISKTRNEYKLTSTVADDGEFLGYQVIPRGMVKSCKIIGE